MPRQKIIAIVFMLGSVATVTGWWIVERVNTHKASVYPDRQHPLVKDPGVGVMYKLEPKMQETLLNAVKHFCVEKYHRESCVHHLSTCGNPCVIAIPKDKRVQIFNDYQTLRKEKGLSMLLKMPPADSE